MKLFLVVLLACVVGCGGNVDEPKKPSYAEALQTYKTELELLEKEKKEQSDLLARYSKMMELAAESKASEEKMQELKKMSDEGFSAVKWSIEEQSKKVKRAKQVLDSTPN